MNRIIEILNSIFWWIIILVIAVLLLFAGIKQHKNAMERIVGHPISWQDAWLTK